MVLDLLIENSIDGFTAKVPSIPECDIWNKCEDEAISKAIDLVCYYTKVDKKKIKFDRARKEDEVTIYKLIIPVK